MPDVRLRPMTPAELADFADRQSQEYARQKVNAGDWLPDKALSLARAEHARLRDGRALAEGHVFLLAVEQGGERVGWIWAGPSPTSTSPPGERFLFQITVEETLRGRGYGRAMLAALHERLRSEGAPSLLLNVFKWNEAAIGLYRAMGYQVAGDFGSSMHMRKTFA